MPSFDLVPLTRRGDRRTSRSEVGGGEWDTQVYAGVNLLRRQRQHAVVVGADYPCERFLLLELLIAVYGQQTDRKLRIKEYLRRRQVVPDVLKVQTADSLGQPHVLSDAARREEATASRYPCPDQPEKTLATD